MDKQKDLELKNQQGIQKGALRIEKMRKDIQNIEVGTKDLVDDLDDEFFNQLHDKIMQKVEKTTIEEPKPWDKTKRYLRAHYRGWLYSSLTLSAGLAFALVVGQSGLFKKSTSLLAEMDSASRAVVLAAQESPEAFSGTVLNDGLEAQFFVDAASESFENLNISQMRSLLAD